MNNRIIFFVVIPILALAAYISWLWFSQGKGRFLPLAEAQELAVPRSDHTATLLPDGRVLVAGGFDGTSTLRTAELFDPGAKSFRPTGRPMIHPRESHTATLLLDGRVLLSGGRDRGCQTSGGPCDHDSAEIYDPQSENFSSAGSMGTPRVGHTAILLPGFIRLEPPQPGGYLPGHVLVTGGVNGGVNGHLVVHASAEIFDPVTSAFTPAGDSMTFPRFNHTMVLRDQTVYVDGGIPRSLGLVWPPRTDAFSNASRSFSVVTVSHEVGTIHDHGTVPIDLENGSLHRLIAGGDGGNAFAPRGIFCVPGIGLGAMPGSLRQFRANHTTTKLQDGRVLLAGGFYPFDGHLQTAELVDKPCLDNNTVLAAPMNAERQFHTATLLQDGAVLIVGGRNREGPLKSAEIFVDTPELLAAYE